MRRAWRLIEPSFSQHLKSNQAIIEAYMIYLHYALYQSVPMKSERTQYVENTLDFKIIGKSNKHDLKRVKHFCYINLGHNVMWYTQ